MKYTNADVVADAPKVSDRISVSAANIPPSDWPLTKAVMYSDGNWPQIPNRPPPRMAEKTKKKERNRIRKNKHYC